MDIYVYTPLPYSLITNTATQFPNGNLMRNLLGILHTCDTMWFDPYSIKYLILTYMHIFRFENIFLTQRLDYHIMSHHTFGGWGL